jgi:hypothetical protein
MSMFSRRYWPDGAPTSPLPPPAEWERLPTVLRLRSPALGSIKIDQVVYDVGWNGSWMKCRAASDRRP